MYELFARYVSVPLITPILLTIGGLIVGAVSVFIIMPSRKRFRALEAELEATRAEHQGYKAEVTQHFQTTSDLVANMTASYKAVYDHLAAGAQRLCEGHPAIENAKFGVPIMIAGRTVDLEPTEPAPERSAEPEPAPAPQGAHDPAHQSQPEPVSTPESASEGATAHDAPPQPEPQPAPDAAPAPDPHAPQAPKDRWTMREPDGNAANAEPPSPATGPAQDSATGQTPEQRSVPPYGSDR